MKKTKSNRYKMCGNPGMGPRLICPGERRYPELHESMKSKRDTIAFNGQFGAETLPKTAIADLRRELAKDRAKFQKIKPDVVVLERQKT